MKLCGCFFLFFFSAVAGFASGEEDLLEQLLRDPVANTAAQSQVPQQGMSVKVYQLGNLRVDAPNGLRAIEVLRKWLPPGSTVTAVPATNSLHILTTESAHSSLSDLLSALDQPIGSGAQSVEPQLKEAIEKFASNSVDPDAMKKIVAQVVQQNSAELQKQQVSLNNRLDKSQQKFYLIVVGFSLGVVLLFTVLFFRTRRSDPASSALVPVNDRQAVVFAERLQQSGNAIVLDVRKALESVSAIQRQSDAARGAEMASFKTQLEVYLSKQNSALEESRIAMERTSQKLDASADSIRVSQEKNELLTDQLRAALHAVDRLEQLVHERDDKLDVQAEELRRKEEEVSEAKNRIAQNMAKVAILAKELGASDEFLNAPLPSFDSVINGTPLAENNESTISAADQADLESEPEMAEMPPGHVPDDTPDENEAASFQFSDPV